MRTGAGRAAEPAKILPPRRETAVGLGVVARLGGPGFRGDDYPFAAGPAPVVPAKAGTQE